MSNVLFPFMAFVMFLALNYVLPLSKDVPGLDGLFDQLLTQKLMGLLDLNV